ncbi:hypothetical protein ACFVXE_38315 [Streptomyces sp. NPDC058231]|uniref:hypothetical protein n=1 Tax=Streptomyces sp. NPDC058231 TaxID=3346392 RepID=UPI0036F11736
MSRSYKVGDTVEHAQVADRGTITEVKSSWKRQASGNTTRVHKYVVDWDNGPQGHLCGPRTFSK